MIGNVRYVGFLSHWDSVNQLRTQRNKGAESISLVEMNSSSPQEVRAGPIVNHELVTQEVSDSVNNLQNE